MPFNLNWFLGVLSIELWLVAYLIVLGPGISAAWRARRLAHRLAREPAEGPDAPRYELARLAS